MSDEPKKRSWKWTGWTALVLFVLWPLSIAPFGWLADTFDGGDGGWQDYVFVVYWPLYIAAKLVGLSEPWANYANCFRQ
jgi:hypothetical protein